MEKIDKAQSSIRIIGLSDIGKPTNGTENAKKKKKKDKRHFIEMKTKMVCRWEKKAYAIFQEIFI